MLTRQRILLALIERSSRPIGQTTLVKLAFLFGHETRMGHEGSFYDFLPYKFGPFSFTLYREFDNLRQRGYLSPPGQDITIHKEARTAVKQEIRNLPARTDRAVKEIVSRYSSLSHDAILKDVYRRYAWYSVNSERSDLVSKSVTRPVASAGTAYTAGYEGRSIDAFLNLLLVRGIADIIDVRANPVSRKYGFAGSRLRELAGKVDIEYHHVPEVGISSAERRNLSSPASYERLLNRYEQRLERMQAEEVGRLADLVAAKPSVFVCMESDPACCHRTRLARVISRLNGIDIEDI